MGSACLCPLVSYRITALCFMIQREVEIKHVDVFFTKDTQEAVLYMGHDKVMYLLLGHTTLFGDPRDLKERSGYRDVRIET